MASGFFVASSPAALASARGDSWARGEEEQGETGRFPASRRHQLPLPSRAPPIPPPRTSWFSSPPPQGVLSVKGSPRPPESVLEEPWTPRGVDSLPASCPPSLAFWQARPSPGAVARERAWRSGIGAEVGVERAGCRPAPPKLREVSRSWAAPGDGEEAAAFDSDSSDFPEGKV